MPKVKRFYAYLGAAIVMSVLFSQAVLAETVAAPTQMKYTLLESLPGFFQAGTTLTDLPALILSLYKFGIWTVGIAGMFMIVIGGISYMTSAGNTSAAKTGKGIITDALLGVVTAFCAYLALYVINPDLTKINLNSFIPVTVEELSITEAEYVPLPGQLSDAEAKKRLSAAGIGVKSNVCAKVTDTGCTTLEGIPSKAINGLIAMKKACPACSFFVTGGTEGGHKTHGPGYPIIDISYEQNVRSFLTRTKSNKAYEKYEINRVCTLPADLEAVSYNLSYTSQCKDPSTEPHFHLSFGL